MELIIFSVVLVVSVLAHYLFWRSSKKRYLECIKLTEAINKKLKQLEESDAKIDKMLDSIEDDAEKVGNEIDALRSVWFQKGKKNVIES